ncbi:MAG: hypothetical protein D6731_13350, partial [Planctomycetota bacterium]
MAKKDKKKRKKKGLFGLFGGKGEEEAAEAGPVPEGERTLAPEYSPPSGSGQRGGPGHFDFSTGRHERPKATEPGAVPAPGAGVEGERTMAPGYAPGAGGAGAPDPFDFDRPEGGAPAV